MVGDDAVRGIDPVGVLAPEPAAVAARARDAFDRPEDGREQVGVVVGVHALEDARDPLEAHPGVDVLVGEGFERAVRLPVVLDEHEVPDLDDVLDIRVDALRGVPPPADPVVVQFRARPAGTRVAHLPEVVLDIPRDHAVLGQVLEPEVTGLEVGPEPEFLIAPEVGRVEPCAVDAPDVREQLPRPVDGFLLEEIPERPVAEHLEERVVIGVLAHVLEVVVLAPRSDALLGVHRPFQTRERAVLTHIAEEDGLELVHPRVGEHQRRVVVRHRGRRWRKGVRLALEELDERSAHGGGAGEAGHGRDPRLHSGISGIVAGDRIRTPADAPRCRPRGAIERCLRGDARICEPRADGRGPSAEKVGRGSTTRPPGPRGEARAAVIKFW